MDLPLPCLWTPEGVHIIIMLYYWLVVTGHGFCDFPYIGNVIIPTDEIIFFRGVGIPPTNQISIDPRKMHLYAIQDVPCHDFPLSGVALWGRSLSAEDPLFSQLSLRCATGSGLEYLEATCWNHWAERNLNTLHFRLPCLIVRGQSWKFWDASFLLRLF